MKTKLIFLSSLVSMGMMLSGCTQFDNGFSDLDFFMIKYEDNFVDQVGEISPEQSWDFSTIGGTRGSALQTRSVTYDDGWYYPQEKTLSWMKNELKEQTDNSSKCNDFYWTWIPGMSFEIVPIYEGLAYMNWDLYMKVTSADGTVTLCDQKIWSKAENVQLKFNSTQGDMQYTENEVSLWYESPYDRVFIWAYDENGHGGDYYTGMNNFGDCEMKKVGKRNDKNVFKWTCNKKNDIPTKVGFIYDNNGTKTNIHGTDVYYTFRNHGYYYWDNPTWDADDAGKSGSPLSLYTPTSVWNDFGELDDANKSDGFRAKPIDLSSINSSEWPLGSIMTFYLQITDMNGADPNCGQVGDVNSSLNKQIVYLNVPTENMPTNVDTGDDYVTAIMGVEDSKISRPGSGSDKDYNDVVFLIHGMMPAPIVIDNEVTKATFEKRYMAEDLTDSGDMDFNDIVVDLKSDRYTYWTVNSSNEKTIDSSINGEKKVTVNGEEMTLNFTNGVCEQQTATIKHLCGTVPIRFKAGDTFLPWITNPSDAVMTKAQLEGNYSNLKYGKGIERTEGNDPNVSFPVTGWNSATNNVSVYVGWKDGAATEPSIDATTAVNADSYINSGSDWQSTFPAIGSVPCIIATDVTDPWTAELVDITTTNWWKLNFISSK